MLKEREKKILDYMKSEIRKKAIPRRLEKSVPHSISNPLQLRIRILTALLNRDI